MSLKHNVIANYVSQFYGTAIGVVMVPAYIRYMGIEAYGLVGFFATLQVLFQLVDMGMTPTLAREVARFRGGAIDAFTLRSLMRALEGIFLALAVAGACVMIAGADYISASWLKAQQLPHAEVRDAISLMALIVALRWMGGLYRGAIGGYERLVWLSGFNVAAATGRAVLVIPFFIIAGATPTTFFGYQLAVAVIELVILVSQTYRMIPRMEHKVDWEWKPLRGVVKFSLGLAFTNCVWIAVTQTDKLVLSRLLTLTDYAYFTLAVLVASGVTIIAGPISIALQPRLTRLEAEGDGDGLVRVYRNATQVVGVIAIPVAVVLSFFSEQVLWAWTGNADIAVNAAPVLTLYALGNGVLALCAFPYYLQVAKGDLKLHLIGNLLFVVFLIPALVWATWSYGMVGAGFAWLASHLAYFAFWTPLVHRRLVKGLHRRWLLEDVGGTFLLTISAAAAARWLVHWPQERIPVALAVGALGMGLLAIAAGASSCVRGAIRQW
ncbi:polysaccharide biosynthesis protein [Noviherbaspirillum denitrificans]|uniref:Polysaccharide biosynthesis protein n=2 Tax=Noviherbaspirillum denitrificans TaxID=1968433 RepID=A0A254T7D9_9BURK|nr:polysaccharide biosynthesis protein [Noviherbaspirillum denitrificans]